MLGDYYFLVTGLVGIVSTTMLIAWCQRYPDRRIPPVLLAGPIVTGALAVIEGAGRLNYL